MTEKIYPTKSYLDPAKRAALLRDRKLPAKQAILKRPGIGLLVPDCRRVR